VYSADRVEIRNDGVTAGMREINGDPLMTMTKPVCPDNGLPPRTDPRPPGSSTAIQPQPPVPTQPVRPQSPVRMETSPPRGSRGPLVTTTTVTTQRPSQTWGRRGQQSPSGSRSPSPSPPPRWTHQVGASWSGGWGWQG
jgi:hypothetical protein